MKKLVGIIIGIAAICAVVYFGCAFYISQMTSDLVKAAWEHENVLPDKYDGVLTLYDFKRLDWANKVSINNIKATKTELSYPSTTWMFNSATTTYYYTVTDNDTNTPLTGCDNVKCTIVWEKQDNKWIVKSFTEE